MKELAMTCLIVILVWIAFIVLISILFTIGIVLSRLGNSAINCESTRNSTELEEK